MTVEAIELLQARRSIGKLGDPAPDGEALERILRAALRAPDHGALRPWKILLVRGAARERFGEVMADALARRAPGASAEELARERGKALRAPLLAIVVAACKESAKIPEVEQLLSAGCVAYGLEIAAQAEGFGAIWKTGAPAYDRYVHERLGLAERDRIVAIVYVGTPLDVRVAGDGATSEESRPAVADLVAEWTG